MLLFCRSCDDSISSANSQAAVNKLSARASQILHRDATLYSFVCKRRRVKLNPLFSLEETPNRNIMLWLAHGTPLTAHHTSPTFL